MLSISPSHASNWRGGIEVTQLACRQVRDHRRASAAVPHTGDPYWDAMYDVAQAKAESCPMCGDAPSLISFAQDVVNAKKGVALYDERNFDNWMKHAMKAYNRK